MAMTTPHPTWVIVSRPAGNRTAYALVNTETWVQAASFNEGDLAVGVARVLNQVGPKVLRAEITAGNQEPF